MPILTFTSLTATGGGPGSGGAVFAHELSRLEALYRTAGAGIADGEPQLSSDAWVALVAASDAWTAFRSARGALFREIRLCDLPLPTDPRRPLPEQATA